MLKELSSVARDLLGLHGYPVASVSPSAAASKERRERPPKRPAKAERKSRCDCVKVVRTFFGWSRMGHVYW